MIKKSDPSDRFAFVPAGLTLLLGNKVLVDQSPDRESVGLKALGLAQLPSAWSPQFFVVSGKSVSDLNAILSAGKVHDLSPDDDVLVRSSGTLEGVSQRGMLESITCRLNEVSGAIARLQAIFDTEGLAEDQVVHFVVQKKVGARAKGHLSNERRVSRQPRDWVAEIEASSGFPSEQHPVAIRKWRDAASPSTQGLSCSNRAMIPKVLLTVAKWAMGQEPRLLFEWVWDGNRVWLVQKDISADRTEGVRPSSLVATAPKVPKLGQLHLFAPAVDEDFSRYPKLRNVAVYSSLGYGMPPFFVLKDQEVLATLRRGEEVPDLLAQDLDLLCKAPFVLRTDAVGLQSNERQMLARSDELRSGADARSWLRGGFIEELASLPNETELVLIGHHFIPATASAWCLAYPDRRRVRIESVWGIPEGLYWYAHDVYDVDTAESDVRRGGKEKCKVLAKRERYKDRFVAPDSNGNWIVHQTSVGPDWQGSIRRTEWIEEIAWTSRLIADAEQKPVVIMWFIDVAPSSSKHKVLPWFHEEWKATAAAMLSAAPRKKRAASSERVIRSRKDWDALKVAVAAGETVERVEILPDDGDIVRERPFLMELAEHAKQNGYVIELKGGVLSHAFYLLTDKGCQVECVDLFAVDEEELQFNKLVRDKVPDEIESRGESVDVVRLMGDALLDALKRKLVEEALEVSDAKSSADVIEELADLQEVILALMAVLTIGGDEVMRARERKKGKRGGFEEGLMLLRTSLDPSVGPPPLLVPIERGQQTISRSEELPSPVESDFHIDGRQDSKGTFERQFTLSLPVTAKTFRAGRHAFGMKTSEGSAHEMQVEVSVERDGPEVKLRVRLINAPQQLEIPLENDRTSQ